MDWGTFWTWILQIGITFMIGMFLYFVGTAIAQAIKEAKDER